MKRSCFPPAAKSTAPTATPLLHALERADYALPNNSIVPVPAASYKVRCARKDSSTRYGYRRMALSQEERKQGFADGCRSENHRPSGGAPRRQVKLFAPRENNQFRRRQTKILHTPRVVELTLRWRSPAFSGPNINTLGGGGLARPLVLLDRQCAASGWRDRAQVARQGPVRPASLDSRELKVGDLVRLSGPYAGTFIGDPAVNTPVLCLPRGWRRSCRWQMPHCVAATRRRSRWCSRHERRTTIYQGLMVYWQMKYRNFRFHPDADARGRRRGCNTAGCPTSCRSCSPTFQVWHLAAGSPDSSMTVRAAAKAGAKDELIHAEAL